MKKYSYLNNPDFLMKAFQERSLYQYIKITVLSFAERPIKEIQGKVTSGTLNINGDSSVRRTANLSVFIEEEEANYHSLKSLFAINKKIKIEIGISNESKDYAEFPILWFPFGIFALMGISLSHDTNGTTASLQLKDKMVFLNGECGGTIPASVVFHELEEWNDETGDYIITKPTIVQIIREMVNHYGGESLNKIIINDLDTRARRVMKWIGSTPLYVYQTTEQITDNENNTVTNVSSVLYTDNLEQIKEDSGKENLVLNEDYQEYSYGTDVGFTYGDFTYPGELIGNAGDSVCTILDTIKNTLGNYEYFYDVYGNFIFQEIKNYLNTSKATVDLKYINQDNYLIDRAKGKAKYIFNNNYITTSFSNAPQYNMIKNDFIVWGMREGVSGDKIPIRYHLSIDNKPKVGNTYCVFFQEDGEGFSYAKIPIEYEKGLDFPTIGDTDRIYLDKSTGRSYVWRSGENQYLYPTDDCPVPCDKSTVIQKIYKEDTANPILFYSSNYACLTSSPEIRNKQEFYKDTQTKLEQYEAAKEKKNELEQGINLLQEQITKVQSIIAQGSSSGVDIPGYQKKLAELIDEVMKTEEELQELNEKYPAIDFNINLLTPALKELELDIFKMQQSFAEESGAGACTVTTTDWRTELYLSGAMSTRYGTASNYYYTELSNEWSKLYDIEKGEFKSEVLEAPHEIDYFLDFIDSTAAISELNISNIGRRTKIVNDDKINCIFETEIPNYVLISTGDGEEEVQNKKMECLLQGQSYVLVSSRVFDNLALGGTLNSAYNMVRDLLYQYTSYNEAITVQMLPLYFLEPNIRITVQDKESGIRGDYVIKSISIPFDVNGTMSLSCNKALERI